VNPISCHLITWDRDYEAGLREAAALGFRACELFTRDALAFEDDPARFRALLDAHGLRLSALYAGGRFTDPAQREAIVAYNARVARLLAALGVDRIVFGPAGPRTPGGTSDDALREAARTIDAAARATAELGVLACVHPHLGTEIETERELDAVMAATDPARVLFCPDTAHLTAAGVDVAAAIRRYGDRLGYLHIKDLRAGVVEQWRARARGEAPPEAPGEDRLPIFCELGRGVVDFAPIVAALRAVGYGGWITVEIDRSLTTARESLAICRDYLRDRLGMPLEAGAPGDV
jgi:inosose dehydratase